jgi:hypothetical protein
MAVYYFDLREGGAFVVDEEGTELRDVEAAQAEAARSLLPLKVKRDSAHKISYVAPISHLQEGGLSGGDGAKACRSVPSHWHEHAT